MRRKEHDLITLIRKGEIVSANNYIRSGADINVSSINGETPLFIAATEGHGRIVLDLVRRSNVNYANSRGKTSLFVAAEKGHQGVVDILACRRDIEVDKSDDHWDTPLLVASRKGFLEIVKILIKNKAGIDKANKEGETPLSAATRNGHLEVVKELIREGANVDKANKEGETPAFIAAEKNYIEILRELKKGNANINKANKDGQTPAHIVVFKNAGNNLTCPDVLKCLVGELGADTSLKTKNKGSFAGFDGSDVHDMSKVFNGQSSKIYQYLEPFRKPKEVANNLDKPPTTTMINSNKKSAVYKAQTAPEKPKLPLYTADSYQPLPPYPTDSHYPQEDKQPSHQVDKLQHLKSLLRLVKGGNKEALRTFLISEPINIYYSNTWTALHAVVFANQLENVKFLIEKLGADPLLKTKEELGQIPAGSDAFDIAKKQGNEETIKYLKPLSVVSYEKLNLLIDELGADLLQKPGHIPASSDAFDIAKKPYVPRQESPSDDWINRLHAENKELRVKNEKLEFDNVNLQLKAHNHGIAISDLQTQNKDLEKGIFNTLRNLSNTERSYSELFIKYEELRAKNEKLEAENENLKHEKEVEYLRNAKNTSAFEQKKKILEENIANISDDLDHSERRCTELSKTAEQIKNELDNLNKEKANDIRLYNQKAHQYERAINKIEQYQQRIRQDGELIKKQESQLEAMRVEAGLGAEKRRELETRVELMTEELQQSRNTQSEIRNKIAIKEQELWELASKKNMDDTLHQEQIQTYKDEIYKLKITAAMKSEEAQKKQSEIDRLHEELGKYKAYGVVLDVITPEKIQEEVSKAIEKSIPKNMLERFANGEESARQQQEEVQKEENSIKVKKELLTKASLFRSKEKERATKQSATDLLYIYAKKGEDVKLIALLKQQQNLNPNIVDNERKSPFYYTVLSKNLTSTNILLQFIKHSDTDIRVARSVVSGSLEHIIANCWADVAKSVIYYASRDEVMSALCDACKNLNLGIELDIYDNLKLRKMQNDHAVSDRDIWFAVFERGGHEAMEFLFKKNVLLPIMADDNGKAASVRVEWREAAEKAFIGKLREFDSQIEKLPGTRNGQARRAVLSKLDDLIKGVDTIFISTKILKQQSPNSELIVDRLETYVKGNPPKGNAENLLINSWTGKQLKTTKDRV